MRASTALTRMLIAFPLLVCAQGTGSADRDHYNMFIGGTVTRPRPLQARKNPPDSDVLRRTADDAAARAASLRQKQTGKNLNTTVLLLGRSVRLYKAAGAYDKAAESDLRLGESLFILSRYSKALASFGEALALAGENRELRCRALSRLARTYANRGEDKQAEGYSKKVEENCESSSPGAQAEALEARGETIQYTDLHEATKLFTRARELFAAAGDRNGEGQILVLLAYIQLREDRAKGVDFARQALQIFISTGNSYGIAKAYSVLGALAAATDRFAIAQCNHQNALERFQTIGDRDSEAATLNWFGHTSLARGDIEASLWYYRRARKIFHKIPDLVGEVAAIAGMASALTAMHRDRDEDVLRLYEEEFRLAPGTRNPAQIARADLDRGVAYELQHDDTQAEKYYRLALEKYGDSNFNYGRGDALMRLVRLQIKQSLPSEAIKLLQNALSAKTQSDQREGIARLHYELASIYYRLKRFEDAREAISETIKIIETQGLTIEPFDSRAAYFASVHRYYALYIEVLMILHRQYPEQGFMQLAFEVSEESKVRSLQTLLEVSAQVLPCNELLQRQSQNLPDSHAEAPSASPSDSFKLSEIQAEIQSNETVLEFFLGDERSYLWLVGKKQIEVHELPPAARIKKLAGQARNALIARLESPPGEDPREKQKRVLKMDEVYLSLAPKLWNMLRAGATPGPATRLIIVPDGFLQNIPFSALVTEYGGQHEFLADRHEVVLWPSVSAIMTLRKRNRERPPPARDVVVIADPDTFDSQATSALAGDIQAIFGQKNVSVKLSISKESVLQGGIDFNRYVHFSVHGIIDAQNPEIPRLILSFEDRSLGRKESDLRLGDIYKLKLSADLVVLSACESGLGRNMASEGIMGLPRGFLYSGARSVIASLWMVEGPFTRELMKDFYAELHRGKSPAAALRIAQSKMAQKKIAPFFWAAFVLQGEYN